MSYTPHHAIALLKLWSFLGPAIVQPTLRGASNKTYFVDAPAGKFILKLYGDSTTTAQIKYEHSILLYLRSREKSFAVPTPIPTESGETLVLVNKNNIPLRVALFPLLPGQPANRNNIDHTRAAGLALGELHLALANFDLSGELAQLPPWGDLYHIHPLVKPFEIPQLLGLNSIERSRLVKMLTEVIEAKPYLYKTLPVQTIHADYLSPNILLENKRVAAVLDFEFATKDLRLIDYICGLDHFALFPWQQAPHWDFVKAFSVGYSEYVSLSKQEAEAMTITWRSQRLSSIVYWTGWFLEGKVTRQSVLNAVTETLLLENWLEDNEEELLNYILHA